MRGLSILARTMSKPRIYKTQPWQYHPRSDHHSKVACWAVLFDLLINSELMREHTISGKIAFGINQKLVDHTNNRPKALDLVICRPSVDEVSPTGMEIEKRATFAELAKRYDLALTPSDLETLAALPTLYERQVGTVLMALEAKAAMTAFAKARPRLYDELASSHIVVHGDTDSAIAVGLVLINGSPDFVSPTNNPGLPYGAPVNVSHHDQPKQTLLTIDKIRSLPRREAPGKPGFDAIAAVTLQCRNDGATPVTIEDRTSHGALKEQDVLHYTTLINRTVGIYQSRFPKG